MWYHNTMNIFLLSEQNCPIESASMMCDQHIVKMCIESCQLLATCFTLDRLAQDDCPKTQKGTPRKHFNINHPCSKWVVESTSNIRWLIRHCEEIFRQYSVRYGRDKRHFTEDFLDWVIDNIDDVLAPEGNLTPFKVAISDDSICRNIPEFETFEIYEQYRKYYIHDKPFATWDKGVSAPDWFSLDNGANLV